jgi:hypothetical protein
MAVGWSAGVGAFWRLLSTESIRSIRPPVDCEFFPQLRSRGRLLRIKKQTHRRENHDIERGPGSHSTA